MIGQDVVQLVPTRPDAEVAADLKRRMVEAYGPVLALLDEAAGAGFHVNLQAGMGLLGRHIVTVVQVSKVF